MSIRWTKEQEEQVLVLLAEGNTVEQISEQFGKTPGNIRTKVKLLLDALLKVKSVVEIEGERGLTPAIIRQFTQIPEQEIYAYRFIAETHLNADIAAIRAQLNAAIDALDSLEQRINSAP